VEEFIGNENLFCRKTNYGSAKPWTALPRIPVISEQINTSLLAGRKENLSIITGLIFILGLLWLLLGARQKYRSKKISVYLILFLWTAFSLIGLGFITGYL